MIVIEIHIETHIDHMNRFIGLSCSIGNPLGLFKGFQGVSLRDNIIGSPQNQTVRVAKNIKVH